MRIGVVGDIHGSYYLLKKAVQGMGRIDLLLFTGDGCREIRRLQEETGLKIEGVTGNCDFSSKYPPEQILYLDQYKIFLTHGHFYRVKDDLNVISQVGKTRDVQLVVFGHTHLPISIDMYGVQLFNPGTLSRERAYQGTTYGMIEITEKGLYLSHGKV